MTLHLLASDKERKWSTNAFAFSLHTNFIRSKTLKGQTEYSSPIWNDVGFELIGRIFVVSRSIVSHFIGIIHFDAVGYVWPPKFRSQWKSIVPNCGNSPCVDHSSAAMQRCGYSVCLKRHRRLNTNAFIYMSACGWMCSHNVLGILNAISFECKMNGWTAGWYALHCQFILMLSFSVWWPSNDPVCSILLHDGCSRYTK